MNSNQKKWLLIVLVVAALNAGIWIMGISPTRSSIDEVDRRTAAAEAKEAQLIQRLLTLNEIDTAALEQEQQEQLIQIPDAGLLREIITELEAVALDKDNELTSMNIQPPIEDDIFQRLSIRMSLTGYYDNLCSYIKYLETHSRLILVDNFNLSGAEDSMSLDVSLTIFASDFDTYTPHEAPGRDNPFAVE